MAEGNSLEVRGFQSHLFYLHGRHKPSWNACNPIWCRPRTEKFTKRISHRLLENFSDGGVSFPASSQ